MPTSPTAVTDPVPVGKPARDLLSRAESLRLRVETSLDAVGGARTDVERCYVALREEMVRRELSTIPIARLRESTGGRLRFGPLERAGFSTVLDVLDARPSRLEAVKGVGEQTATQVVAAARQIAAAARDGMRVRVDLDPNNPLSTALITALHQYGGLQRIVDPVDQELTQLPAKLANAAGAAQPARGRLKMMFVGGARKREALAALDQVRMLVNRASRPDVRAALDASERSAQGTYPSSREIWDDFARRAADYYGLLGQAVDLGLDLAASEGFLPAEIVAQVDEQQLDETFSRVSLRGYQSFGARFALVQRRVIIGDEMGLGKTIQAIAAIAHLRSLKGTHFLVVCPASVLINWLREVTARSTVPSYRLHGIERERSFNTWITRGGVGVTTFEALGGLVLPHDLDISMVVVDEAHYVKNPAARRSRAVSALADRVDRVLFLTGTPMENRVSEFRALVSYLRPELALTIRDEAGVAGADTFRRAVAPVYLRRNQQDVLTELPERVHVDEWEELSRQDLREYRSAVLAGNFMAMRRAAFASGDPATSAKLQRLVEIVDEARENGHKVVVFSFFRDVVATVHRVLGARALGPLVGSQPPAKRQELVDAFTRSDGHAVLVSQIQAGGVGLNMQAASIVVLCEPQVKPTMEDQAVARAHRMGQVRTVQVHRLLAADSVDQRMLEILAQKSRLFDEYARRSDLAESSPDAVDVSEVDMARRVVAMEQERLAQEAVLER